MNAVLMWTVNDFPAYEMLLRLLHIECRHVWFVKINYEAATYSTEGKCLGLIIIIVFSHDTMHSGGIGMLLLREKQ